MSISNYHYSIYGFHMISDLMFPQLMTTSIAAADIVVSHGKVACQLPVHDSNVLYEFHSKLSWIENKTCYLLVQNSNSITYELKKDAKEAYLRNYILGWGMSMLAMQRGEPAIHCSAVSRSGQAILFCGESGSGKSTLTRAYIEMGYQLMADDMALVEYRGPEGAWVKPAFPYQKLCRDAALRNGQSLENLIYIDEDKDKFLVPCHNIFDSKSRHLQAIILLVQGNVDKIQVHKPEGLQAFYICVNNLFLRHLLKDQKYDPAVAEKCLKIASCTPVYVIVRPIEQDTTQEVIAAAKRITDSLEEC